MENATEGVFYFADDDNTYDSRIFDLIRTTQKVSVFPVGLIGKYGLSSPVVVNGSVQSFYDAYNGGRTFKVDMAGFAVNVQFYRNVSKGHTSDFLKMPAVRAKEEDGFLKSLGVGINDLEVLTPEEVLVWHTKTQTGDGPRDPGSKFLNTNIENLWKTV